MRKYKRFEERKFFNNEQLNLKKTTLLKRISNGKMERIGQGEQFTFISQKDDNFIIGKLNDGSGSTYEININLLEPRLFEAI